MVYYAGSCAYTATDYKILVLLKYARLVAQYTW